MNDSTGSVEPRILPVDNPTSEQVDVLAKSLVLDGKVPNAFTTLAHNPRLLKRHNLFGGLLINSTNVPMRDREIVTVRVSYNCRCVYEVSAHFRRAMELKALERHELEALLDRGSLEALDKLEQMLVRFSDELCRDNVPSDEPWDALASHYNDS